MTVYQFFAEGVGHIGNVKFLFLLSYLTVKKYMEQYIAKLLFDIGIIFGEECVAEFVHLLDCIRPQRLVCLHPVPRTFETKLVEHVDYTPESLDFFLTVM